MPSPAVCNNLGVEAYGEVTQLPKLTWEVPDQGVQVSALGFSRIISTGPNVGNHVLPLMYIRNAWKTETTAFGESCLEEQELNVQEETVVHWEPEEQTVTRQTANPGHRTYICAFHKGRNMHWMPVRDGEGQDF